MAITTFSSREFNQDTGRAKKAADKGPVFITDRGRPAHVLLTIKQYRALSPKKQTILDLIGMDDDGEIEFEPPRLGDDFLIPAEFE